MLSHECPKTTAWVTGPRGASGRFGSLGIRTVASFRSTSQMKVDKKGRVSLPAELRAELSPDDQRIMLFRPADTSWVNGCAYADFDRVLEEMEAAIPGVPRSQAQRLTSNILGVGEDDDIGDTYAEAVMVSLDPEGRFVLPDLVRQPLGITDAVTFVGRRSTFQLWHPDAYEARREESRVRRLQRYSMGEGRA
jgi:MraZ protein